MAIETRRANLKKILLRLGNGLDEDAFADAAGTGGEERQLSSAEFGDVDISVVAILDQIQRIAELRESVDAGDRLR